MRGLRRVDFPQTERLYNAIFGEHVGRRVSLVREEPFIYSEANARYCLGVFDGKRLVSHAVGRPARVVIEGAEFRWASYGNVMTDPGYRGRGIASRVNATIWGRMRRDGVDGVYISGGRGLYVRMGAVACGDYRGFAVPLARLRFGRGESGVRIARPADRAALVRLHNREPVALRKKPVDFAPLLRTGYACFRRAAAWLVLDRGRPVAYAVVDRAGSVVDYAGPRPALVGAFGRMLARTRARRLGITVRRGDTEMLRRLRGLGGKEWHEGVHGTQLLLDPVRWFGRLKPYLAGRIGAVRAGRLRLGRAAGGGYEFACDRERFEVPDVPSLARLLFGEEPRRWARRLPRRGELRVTLEEALPVPFPAIGLNWV